MSRHAQVLVGLGAALLSDERHAHVKTGGHRPVDLKKIMATLVVQRALKRNMMQKRGKFYLADVVLAAESKTRRVSRTRQDLPHADGLHNLLGSHALEDTGRLSSTGQLSTTGLGGLEGQDPQLQRWQQQQQRQQQEGQARGRMGSVVLPPDADESKWLMQRFLVDLQRRNDSDDEEGGELLSTSRSGSVSQAVASGGSHTAVGGTTALQLLNSGDSSRSSRAGTEIGSPSPRNPARPPDRNDIFENGIPDEESVDGDEEKTEEMPLAMWLRGRDSVGL